MNCKNMEHILNIILKLKKDFPKENMGHMKIYLTNGEIINTEIEKIWFLYDSEYGYLKIPSKDSDFGEFIDINHIVKIEHVKK